MYKISPARAYDLLSPLNFPNITRDSSHKLFVLSLQQLNDEHSNHKKYFSLNIYEFIEFIYRTSMHVFEQENYDPEQVVPQEL